LEANSQFLLKQANDSS